MLAGERTYTKRFFTRLKVTADNLAEVARAGRARSKIEHEGCNCLARHRHTIRSNFGHGSNSLANLLATLSAFPLHAVLDCVSDL